MDKWFNISINQGFFLDIRGASRVKTTTLFDCWFLVLNFTIVPSYDRTIARSFYEAHVSTEQSQAQEKGGLPRTHGNRGWPQGHQASSSQGSRTAFRMSEATFPREVRLTRADEFARVRKHGQRSRSGSLLISYVAGRSKRLGVILTRRIGNAVTRNRIRRVIREFFRVNRACFPVGDCVVIPQAGSAKASNDELENFLRKGLLKLKERKR